ncbi:MAG TPA: FtsX-like permease family protein, partial [Candidatus Acidoferrum sp.]|nr:FtsX-like permease family protein [Candidatus Acidoferrum sp.]
ALKPMMFTLPPRLDGNVAMLPKGALRLSGNDVQGTLQRIDQVWKQFLPDFPVSHYFLDDTFNAMYLAETRQGSVLNAFSLLAIVIACMGLYGLASFNAQRRMKEIGVRKVMGGSVWSIVLLLTNDFSKLVLIANVVAWPVAYYAMHNWLQNFAYRIDLTPLVFIGSGLIALCIAWVTVGGTAAKAASQKPVLALRYE